MNQDIMIDTAMMTVLHRLPLRLYRCLYVKAVMCEQKKNLADIARKHHVTRGYFAGCVNGRYNWSKRTIGILNAELGISMDTLRLFLEPYEW